MTDFPSSPETELVNRVADAINDAVAQWQPGSPQRIKEMAARAAIETVRLAQTPSETAIADAIRAHFKSIGNSAVVSSDGIERVYYNGFSLIKLAEAIASSLSSTVRPFDIMDTIDPDYAESFDRADSLSKRKVT